MSENDNTEEKKCGSCPPDIIPSARPRASRPSFYQKLKTAAQAVGDIVTGNANECPQELRDKRLQICSNCDNILRANVRPKGAIVVYGDRCRICECYLKGNRVTFDYFGKTGFIGSAFVCPNELWGFEFGGISKTVQKDEKMNKYYSIFYPKTVTSRVYNALCLAEEKDNFASFQAALKDFDNGFLQMCLTEVQIINDYLAELEEQETDEPQIENKDDIIRLVAIYKKMVEIEINSRINE